MKKIFSIFVLGVFLIQGVCAEVYLPMNPSGPKVSVYAPAARPPSAEEIAEQKAEKGQNPQAQMLKQAAMSTALILGTSAVVAGFTNKTNRDACLAANHPRTTYQEVKDSKMSYFIWDTRLSFRNQQRCLECCPVEDQKANETYKPISDAEMENRYADCISFCDKETDRRKTNCIMDCDRQKQKRFRPNECIIDTKRCSAERFNSQMKKLQNN